MKIPVKKPIVPLVLAAALLSSHAWPAGAPAEAEPAPIVDEEIEDITVTGQRPDALRQRMENFVIEIADPASHTRGYARWHDRLCVGVYNLPDAKTAQYIADKVTLVALEVGVKTGSPGCKPNLHVVFSPDGRELASSMVEASPRMFRPFGSVDGTTQGLTALEEFSTSDAPVRWWQVTMVVDEVGIAAITLPGINDVNPVTGEFAAPVARGEVSRLKGGVEDALWGSLVIVDVNKLGNAKWPQLADYIAMVSLAQIDPGSAPAQDSILNLFSAAQPPRGLTDMDRIYLSSLYAIDTMRLPHTQRGLLSNQMVRETNRAADD